MDIYIDIYIYIYLSLPIYLSTYPPIDLSTYLAIYLSTYLPIYLPTYLPSYLAIYLSINISLSLFLSISLYVYLSIYPSIHPSIHPSIRVSICLIYVILSKLSNVIYANLIYARAADLPQNPSVSWGLVFWEWQNRMKNQAGSGRSILESLWCMFAVDCTVFLQYACINTVCCNVLKRRK